MYSIDDGINWVPFKDSDYSKLRINLERAGFKSTNKEATRDAVLLVAESNSFDSAQLWLNAIEWDEVNRVDSFMPTYIGTEDNPYYRAAGRYLWTALAGRVLSPGCKADMSPVLVGKQGTRKSSAVAAMSPDPMYFTEISFDEKDDDLSRKMRGCLIAEIAELRGLRTKDMEHVKAWITKQYENWVPKYREFSTTFPRRLVFIGTTNNEEFLADETGNRRWLPVRVNSVIDVDQITRDRTQLWAEAREIFKVRGVEYREAEVLAVQVHAEHMMSDPWVSIVANWLQKGDEYDYQSIKPSELPYLQTHEVLRRALNMGANRCGKWEEMRVGIVLRALGYERKKKRIGTQTLQVYVPTVPSNEYWWEHRTP
jgi:predicted P-loop ATPase